MQSVVIYVVDQNVKAKKRKEKKGKKKRKENKSPKGLGFTGLLHQVCLGVEGPAEQLDSVNTNILPDDWKPQSTFLGQFLKRAG